MRRSTVTLPLVGVLGLGLGLGLGFLDCKRSTPAGSGPKQESTAGEIRAKSGAPPTPGTPPPQPGQATAPTGHASAIGEPIGIPECDAYLTKMEKCLGRVPEAGRPMMKRTLDLTREAWKRSSVTPQGKAGLRTACKVATNTAKAATEPYRCEW